MDNVKKIVSRHNMKIINNQNPPPPKPPCRCRNLSPLCPNQCKTKNVIYLCRVTPPNQNVQSYTGLTSQTFKKRWDQHMSDCRRGEGTTLASHIGELKAKLTLSPIFIGPSRSKQNHSIQSLTNVYFASGKSISFYMNHGMPH